MNNWYSAGYPPLPNEDDPDKDFGAWIESNLVLAINVFGTMQVCYVQHWLVEGNPCTYEAQWKVSGVDGYCFDPVAWTYLPEFDGSVCDILALSAV